MPAGQNNELRARTIPKGGKLVQQELRCKIGRNEIGNPVHDENLEPRIERQRRNYPPHF